MAKKLCAWKKDDIEGKKKKLVKIVREPRFLCRKCARAASDKSFLCKPEAIE